MLDYKLLALSYLPELDSIRCPNNRLKVYFWMLQLRRGPKAPKRTRRAPKPSTGARRRGA